MTENTRPGTAWTRIIELPADAGLPEKQPTEKPFIWRLKDDLWVLSHQGKDVLGNDKETAVGSVKIESNALQWRWAANDEKNLKKLITTSRLIVRRSDGTAAQVFLGEPKVKRIKADSSLNSRAALDKSLTFAAEADLPAGWIVVKFPYSPQICVVGRNENEIVRVSLIGDSSNFNNSDQIQAKHCLLSEVNKELLSPQFPRKTNKPPINEWMEEARQQLQAASTNQSAPAPGELPVFRFLLVTSEGKPAHILEVEK